MDENENEIGVFDEQELIDLVKRAYREVQKETEEEKDEEIEKEVCKLKEKYKHLNGKKKFLAMLKDKKEEALFEACSYDVNTPEHDKALNKYEHLERVYNEVNNNPLWRVDWSKVIITLIMVGSVGILIFLMLIIENSAAFPRSRNALNMILALLKRAM